MERRGQLRITTFDKRPIVARLFFPVSSHVAMSFSFLPSPLMRPTLSLSLCLVRLPLLQIDEPRIPKFFVEGSMISRTVSHPTDLYRFPARNSRTDGRAGFRETLMVRVRISIACATNGGRRIGRRVGFAVLHLFVLEINAEACGREARWIPSNYTHR